MWVQGSQTVLLVSEPGDWMEATGTKDLKIVREVDGK